MAVYKLFLVLLLFALDCTISQEYDGFPPDEQDRGVGHPGDYTGGDYTGGGYSTEEGGVGGGVGGYPGPDGRPFPGSGYPSPGNGYDPPRSSVRNNGGRESQVPPDRPDLTGVMSDSEPAPESHYSSDFDNFSHLFLPPPPDGDAKRPGDTDSESHPVAIDKQTITTAEPVTVDSGNASRGRSAQSNMTVEVIPEDNFNYVALYITVAVFIAFVVTLVVIALIRGPQGPFKTKRSTGDPEVINQSNPEVITLDNGTYSNAHWEQQALRSGEECETGDLSTRVNIVENPYGGNEGV